MVPVVGQRHDGRMADISIGILQSVGQDRDDCFGLFLDPTKSVESTDGNLLIRILRPLDQGGNRRAYIRFKDTRPHESNRAIEQTRMVPDHSTECWHCIGADTPKTLGRNNRRQLIRIVGCYSVKFRNGWGGIGAEDS